MKSAVRNGFELRTVFFVRFLHIFYYLQWHYNVNLWLISLDISIKV